MSGHHASRPLILLAVALAAATDPAASGRDYPVQPAPFTAVHLNDVFWAPRIETNRVETIPFAFRQCELSGRVDNFIRAAKALRGEPLENTKPPGYPFDDTDLYKVIEGASYALSVQPDPKLDAYVDSLIEKIAAAQEKDGYLYTTRTINPASPHPWAGTERWELERDDSHELYNLGHLYEAAVAHYQATGKRTLLDVAIRTADHWGHRGERSRGSVRRRLRAPEHDGVQVLRGRPDGRSRLDDGRLSPARAPRRQLEQLSGGGSLGPPQWRPALASEHDRRFSRRPDAAVRPAHWTLAAHRLRQLRRAGVPAQEAGLVPASGRPE